MEVFEWAGPRECVLDFTVIADNDVQHTIGAQLDTLRAVVPRNFRKGKQLASDRQLLFVFDIV